MQIYEIKPECQTGRFVLLSFRALIGKKLLDRVRTFHVRPDVAIWLSRKAVGIKEKPLIMIDYQQLSLYYHLIK